MDAFDLYLYNELTRQYAANVLTREEQESLYIRMGNLEELEELKPYLYAMRYFGWGTTAEPAVVLAELKDSDAKTQPMLAGLYQDLILSTGKGTEQNKKLLEDARKKGYTEVYLKQKSALAVPVKKPAEKPKEPAKTATQPVTKPNITRVALFKSVRNKPRAEDMNSFTTFFLSKTLDGLYVKTMFKEPGTTLKIPYRLHIENLNTGKTFHNSTGTANLGPKDNYHWVGVWVTKGQWPVAKYRLTLEFGESRHQILFTVS